MSPKTEERHLVNLTGNVQFTSQTSPVESQVRRHSKAEEYLQVRGWKSNYRAVHNLLAHLLRKSKSEGSKRLYIWHLHKFCEYTGKGPNELVAMKRNQAEKWSQRYADNLANVSPRYSNLAIAVLKAFYSTNGFKRGKRARKAYETVLHSQLIDGGNLSVKVQEFFMGHVLPGSQDPHFDRSKIEHMRNQYSRLKFGRSAVENNSKLARALSVASNAI